jgi:hypothetical protein
MREAAELKAKQLAADSAVRSVSLHPDPGESLLLPLLARDHWSLFR